ncbi:MAG: CcmD family protein [Chloroflexota bacterium]|nr:CcmD family protein [Chloroflexota bacterium]
MEDNLEYLLAAFSLVWLAVFVYVFYLSRKQVQLEQQVESLKRRLAEEKTIPPVPPRK